MTKKYNLTQGRQGRDGKTYWQNIGVMFPMKEKDGFVLSFNALPLPQISEENQIEIKVSAFFDDGTRNNNDGKIDF
jgi:hypothetical protein